MLEKESSDSELILLLLRSLWRNVDDNESAQGERENTHIHTLSF